MKTLLKYLLTLLGILRPLKKFLKLDEESLFQKKFGAADVWVLKKANLQVIYNTKDRYSKHWFYPRYADGKIHEPGATDIFIQKISKTSVVLDIGGHIGYFTCLASSIAVDGQVHTFEVDPNCIDLINQNIVLNGFTNVHINSVAVSNNNGNTKIPKGDQPNPKLFLNEDSDNFLEVASVTVDEYLSSRMISPHFIKIDVEGAEALVLEGMSQTLRLDGLELLIEIHVDELETHFNKDYKEILRVLDENHFKLYVIQSHRESDNSMTKIEIDEKLEGNQMIFCTKESIIV